MRFTIDRPCDAAKKSTGSQIFEITSIPKKPPKGRRPTKSPEEKYPLQKIERESYDLTCSNCVHDDCHAFVKLLKKDGDIVKIAEDWRVKSPAERYVAN